MHHSYYDLHKITATKIEDGRVDIYFEINENDDCENLPNGNSKEHLEGMRKKLDRLLEEGVFESISSNTLRAWPNNLRFRFKLQKNERFVRASLAMCVRIMGILEARYPATEQIQIEHRTILEVGPGHWVLENLWVQREAEDVIRNLRKKP